MGELLRGVFAVLLDQPEGMRAAEVIAEVERRVPPTAFENDVYPSDKTRRYPKIVRFSTIGAVKAGWLVKENAQWSLTPEGREVYHRLTSPAELMAESDKLYGSGNDNKGQMATTRSVPIPPVREAWKAHRWPSFWRRRRSLPVTRSATT